MVERVKIFVADDDTELLDFVEFLLGREGYQVTVASSGTEALEKITRNPPDLLICDVEMPGIDGFNLVHKISEDVLLRNIPVILMSGKRISAEDRIAGLGVGSDDYVLKPFAANELLARIKAVLRRTEIGLDASPLTRLPGNSSILREIEGRLSQKAPFAVLYADLNNFKAFNDRYGFLKGDEVIRFTARVLVQAVHDVTRGKDFVGHVGGDDFIVVTQPERVAPLCETVIREFDKGIIDFYSPEDGARGCLEVKDRQGQPVTYPIMGIAIGVVTNERRMLRQIGEVSQIGAEVKEHAKSLGGSRFVVDRRAGSRESPAP